MTAPATECGFDWANLVTWGLVILGWAVINWQHNRRETRKEARALLDHILNYLDHLEEKSIAYHTALHHDKMALRELNRRISRLWPMIEVTGLENNETTLVRALAGVRKAITLLNTEARTFSTQDASSSILTGIADANDYLRMELEYAFARNHRKKLSLIQMQRLPWH